MTSENKNLPKKILDREYLHSVSRIGDRLKMLKRDVVKMKDELCYMEEDIQLLADAFDTLFTDLISEIKEKIDYPTEEI
jgi:hypothetical protein